MTDLGVYFHRFIRNKSKDTILGHSYLPEGHFCPELAIVWPFLNPLIRHASEPHQDNDTGSADPASGENRSTSRQCSGQFKVLVTVKTSSQSWCILLGEPLPCLGREEVHLETMLGEGTFRSDNIQMNDSTAGGRAAGSSALLSSTVCDVTDQHTTLM